MGQANQTVKYDQGVLKVADRLFELRGSNREGTKHAKKPLKKPLRASRLRVERFWL
jgi:hypothetical protein